MGLLDFFKKLFGDSGTQNNNSPDVPGPLSERGDTSPLPTMQSSGSNLTAHVKDLGVRVRNGIRYHQYEKCQNEGYGLSSYQYEEPEYNEVLVFYTFLNKYPRIKKPELLHESDYPHMMFSRVGIHEVAKLHKELHSKGFYQRASNRDALQGYKVAEIKTIISDLCLDIKGKKEDLIDSLISQVDESKLSELLADEYYVISDYGREWMQEHELEYDWYTASEDYPSFEDYKALRSQKSKSQIKKEQCLEEIKTDKESFGRYSYDTLIGIYESEGNKREAVICLLKELLIDMSGALNYADWKKLQFDHDIIKETNMIYFTPYLLRTFPKYKDYYEPTMIEQAYKLRLPINACSIDDFRDIAEMMFDGTMDESTRNQYLTRLKKKLVEIGLSKH